MTSPTRRIVQVACAVIWCLLCAGPIFGFAALKPVLVAEGVYNDVCESAVPCPEQDLKLNFMFNVAAILTNMDAIVVGFVLDKYGPRLCGILGSMILFAASMVLANAKVLPGDPWLLGYALLAVGGPFVFISSFHLSNTFVQYSGTILALLTGAFDASSAVFLGFRVSYENFPDLTLSRLFIIYAAAPLFILLAQTFFMPHTSYRSDQSFASQLSTSAGRMESEETALLESSEYTIYGGRRASLVSQDSTPIPLSQYGSLNDLTAKQQLLSTWAILMIIFTTIQMVRINYFVATINSQYTYLLGYEEAQKLNGVFDYLLPIGGVVAIPLIGFILDHLSLVGSWTTVVGVAILLGCLNLIARPWVAYMHVIVFVIFRPLYYTAVSDYTAKIFGFKTFGTVYGVIICISGLFNILQSVLDQLTKETFNLNPNPVNFLILGVTSVGGLGLVGYIKSQSFNLRRQFLEIEAESSVSRPMPGAPADLIEQTEICFNEEILTNANKPAQPESSCGNGGCRDCVCDV